jgi:hypothetical protein
MQAALGFILQAGDERGLRPVAHLSDVSYVDLTDEAGDVVLLSWLPSTELQSLDERDRRGLPLAMTVSLIEWARDVGVRFAKGAAVAAVRARSAEARARRLREIRASPLAVYPLGIAFANWSGSHATWRPAWDAALRTWIETESPPNVRDEPKDDLRQALAEHELMRRVRELEPLSRAHIAGFTAVRPDMYGLARHLARSGEPLRPFYVIEGLGNEVHTERQLRAVHKRALTWLAKAETLSARYDPWVRPASVARLLDLVRRQRFFLFEFLDEHQFRAGLTVRRAQPGDGAALAYTTILSAYPENQPALGVGLAVRNRGRETDGVRPVDALWILLLHELGHLLDAGDDPRRLNAHDGSFYRAYQFNVNLGFDQLTLKSSLVTWESTTISWDPVPDERPQLVALEKWARELPWQTIPRT